MKKWILFLLCFVSFTLYAHSPTKELQAKLNAINNMSANFEQTIKAGKREVSNSLGTIALSRPGRFRWQTKSPLEQIIVADGKKLWIYDVDLEQVIVKKQAKTVSGTPALFLSSSNDTVSGNFDVIKVEKETSNQKDTLQSFYLRAKSKEENYQKVILRFKINSHIPHPNDLAELAYIEFFDQLGQHTLVRLDRVQSNIALAASLFQFKPPKGVDVVRQ